MNTSNNPQSPSGNSFYDEIDLRKLLINLWKHKILISVLALVGAGLGVGLSIKNTNYVSNALLLFGSEKQINLEKFKVYRNFIYDGKRFKEFLIKNEKLDDEISKIFKPVFEKESALEKMIIPEFSSVSNKEAKLLGVKADASEKTYLMGFTLRLENAKPLGEIPLKILGDYIQNTIADIDFEKILETKMYESESGLKTLKNNHIHSDFLTRIEIEQQILKLFESNNSNQEILSSEKITSDFEITQQEKRIEYLQELLPNSSKSRSAESNNILTISKESEVFLPIDVQILANKIRVENLRMTEPRRQFEILAGEIKRQFFLECLNAIRAANSGPEFIDTTRSILNKIIPPDALNNPAYAKAWNDIELNRKKWEVSYMTNIAKFTRERVSAELIYNYNAQLLDSFKKHSDKIKFLKEVPSLKANFFAEKNQAIDFIQIISNKTDVEFIDWSNYYFSKMDFYTLGDAFQQSKPSKPIGLSVGLMAGGMGGCFLALFLSWWKKDSDNTPD